MSRNFNITDADAFSKMVLGAGVVLTEFDPANPVTPSNDTILATTSGGINVVCQPTNSDLASDVDNVQDGMMEYMHLDGWNCNISFTSLTFNEKNTRWSLGAADIVTVPASGSSGAYTIVRPRRDYKLSDFAPVYWVSSMANGGLAAVKVMNAISSSGLNIQTGKNTKGQSTQTITGHPSLNDQNTVPMEFYYIPPEDEGGDTTTYTVTQNLTNVTSSFMGSSVNEGTAFAATLTADTGYTMDTVSVTMGGTDVSSTAYDDTTDTVSIDSVDGNIVITASATEE